MQPTATALEIKTAQEQQLFKGKNFHVFIYNKTESVSGLHQHDYYEFTLVLTGRYYQVINGKRVLLERGDFVFIPLGSHHQSFYEFGATRILNVGISKRFFEQHYLSLLPVCFVASQAYRTHSAFLTYVETVIASLNFSVSDIAWESGYSSPSLFIKTFKKLTSFTPNSYRKRLTEINQ